MKMVDIERAEAVFNERIDKEIAHYAGKLAKKAFRDAIKAGMSETPICEEGWHKSELLSGTRRRCVHCGLEWEFPPAKPEVGSGNQDASAEPRASAGRSA